MNDNSGVSEDGDCPYCESPDRTYVQTTELNGVLHDVYICTNCEEEFYVVAE